ncbi:MAG: phage portal protein [Acidobacteria bacterium]|nr:phage portal protein [Acidobacteriota bacterium]
MIVSSYGALTSLAPPQSGLATVSASAWYDGYRRTYKRIWETQPEVRTVVEFFARNVAQLGIHVFRLAGADDRQRLRDHGLALALQRPNPQTTRYRLLETTVRDLLRYANAYWLKVRVPGRLGLVRLPGDEVSVTGGLLPTGYDWTPGGRSTKQHFEPLEIVHFRDDDLIGFPPIETLRRVLAELAASGQYREQFWKGAARTELFIERPKDAPKQWDREGFRTQLQEFATGGKAGRIPVLEDGMTAKQVSFNARDSQYLEFRKLSREVVAAAYHVPPPLVGILDHATFSNIREQHKQLYQDCLGPTLQALKEDIELQLLPEFGDAEGVYVEFNIHAKLTGSFEEQASQLQSAIGRPYMTVNEGRARLNLPRDPAPESDRIAEAAPGQALTPPRERAAAEARPVFARFFGRQSARLGKVDAEERAAAFDAKRWNRELAADLAPVLGPAADVVARDINRQTLAQLEAGDDPWTDARLDAVVAWLQEEGRL